MLSCTITRFANMSLKTVSVIFVFYTALSSAATNDGHSTNKFLVVSTTETPSGGQSRNNDFFTKELQVALWSLNESITNSLRIAKQEILEQSENRLKESLSKIKQEIIEETKNALNEKFSKIKQEIVASERSSTLRIPRDCKEVQIKGNHDSGVYRIQPYLANDDFTVYCDMATSGGGWTYAINRLDGSQDFYLNWTDYKKGFGNPSGEYWIGLEHLYYLTNSKPSELLVELVDWDSKKVYAHYSKFKIESEFNGYKLAELGEYWGDAGDSMRVHLGFKFTTLDRDQDLSKKNCAGTYKGAWWYKDCFWSHLTGRYIVKNPNLVPYATGLHWKTFRGFNYSLKSAKMMVRPSS